MLFLQLTHTYACGRADDMKASGADGSYGWTNALKICSPRNAGMFFNPNPMNGLTAPYRVLKFYRFPAYFCQCCVSEYAGMDC